MEQLLNPHGQKLAALLSEADKRSSSRKQKVLAAQNVHVVGGGGTVTAAYEQLRNAAEYAEEHMLLQRAIRRFYRRMFLIRDKNLVHRSGEELLIELTLAGYLENDSVSEEIVHDIGKLASEYYDAYVALAGTNDVSYKQAEAWTIEVLAVKIEWLLNDTSHVAAYVQFVHEYLSSSSKLQQLFQQKPADYEIALYTAIHRALLKSDLSVVRTSLLDRYQLSPKQLEQFVQSNRHIDELISSATVEKLFRFVDRHGAPLRILRRMIHDQSDLTNKLTRRDSFLSSFELQIAEEYASIDKRINRGIIKSVAFLVITKVLIGLAIEIPYDYLTAGMILVVPLVINLFFPPVYMLLLRMTLMLPGEANTRRLVNEIDEILYGSEAKQLVRSQQVFGLGFNVAYAAVSVAVFGGVGLLLWIFAGFDLVHLFIFFLFLSGASFLGFRLSRMIREVEAVDSSQNIITSTRDVLYMPFVVVGRFMSEKYSQVNIVALFLDMLIELPLKTILRLLRQWTAFISSKKDEL